MKKTVRAKSFTVAVSKPEAAAVILDSIAKGMVYSLGLVADTKNLALQEVRALLDPAYEKLAIALSEFGIDANKADLFGLEAQTFSSLGYMRVSIKHELPDYIQPYNITIVPPDGSNHAMRQIKSGNTVEAMASEISSLRL